MIALSSVDMRRAGTVLHFSDSFAVSLLLPVLPSVIRLFLGEGATTARIMLWIGLVTCGFTAGRAGILAFARYRSLDPPLPRLNLVILVLVPLGLSHLSCGFISGQHHVFNVLWLLLWRCMAGIMAGLAYLVGIGCLFSDNTNRIQNWDPIIRDTQVEAWGFLCGVGTGGIFGMFRGDRRPLFWVGSIAALLHGAAVIMIVKGSSSSISNKRDKAMYNPLDGLLSPEEGDSSSYFEDRQSLNNALGTSVSPSTPGRYYRGCGDNRSEASHRWKLTLQWRRSEHVDGILDEKQVHFEAIKKYYPHYIYGRAKSGSPVYYDFPGKVDVKALNSEGIGLSELVRHFIFNTEYLWRVVEPNDDAQCVTVLDMSGVTFSDIQGGDKVGFFKATAHITQEHYVERCERLFIINAPSFFSFAWRAALPLLNKNTRKKISVCRKGKHMIELLTCIDASAIPVELGGDCTTMLSESDEEKQLREFVASHLIDDRGLHYESLEIEKPMSCQSQLNDVYDYEDTVMEDIECQNSNKNSSLQSPMEEGKVLRWLVGLRKNFMKPAVQHAYVGETNRYFYDKEAHAWVLRQDRDTARFRIASDQGEEGYFYNADNTPFDGGFNEEEELTVMAIQAAQLARTTTCRDSSSSLAETPHHACSASSEEGSEECDSLEHNSVHVEEKVLPWLAFRKTGSRMNIMSPSLASVWYLILVAMQAIVPAWLLFPNSGGGLGWHTREVMLVLLMMGGGMALIRAAIASHLSSKSMERDGPRRISAALLVHVVTVAPLCIFSSVMNKKTSAITACTIAAWTAVTVSLNGTLLLLCRSQRLATCRHFHSEGAAAWMDCRSLLFSEVGGSMLGPMVVAFCSWLGFGMGISMWFPICVGIDMLLWWTAKPAEPTTKYNHLLPSDPDAAATI